MEPAAKGNLKKAALFRGAPLFPVSFIALVVLTALFGPFLAPHSPTEISLENQLRPPFWLQGGGMDYPLGTDKFGRDILSRLIYGSRVSLTVSLLGIGAGGLLGAVLGLVSGYLGGWVDGLIMRVADLALSLPVILLAFVLAIVLGPSFGNVILVLVLILWARYARQIRGEVLSIKERDFVVLARLAGCSPGRIILRHVFPNVTNTLIVLATLQVGWAILLEASLSFLGAGIPPPQPAWGLMVADGREYVLTAWWVSFLPALAILLTVLSVNLLGDWLRDYLDPKLRQI